MILWTYQSYYLILPPASLKFLGSGWLGSASNTASTIIRYRGLDKPMDFWKKFFSFIRAVSRVELFNNLQFI